MKVIKPAASAALILSWGVALPVQAQAPAEPPAKCEFKKLGDMTVDLTHGTPRVPVAVNGQKRWVELNTTSPFSTLRLEDITAFAGERQPTQAAFSTVDKNRVRHPMKQYRLRDILLGDAVRLDAWDVIESIDPPADRDLAGFVGQDLLVGPDIEFDFANNRISIFTETNCANDSLAYWDGAISETELAPARGTVFGHVIRPMVTLNDHLIVAELSTTLSASVVNTPFGRRVGLKAGGPGVETLAGFSKPTLSAKFDTFVIGGEKIGHPTLSMQEMFPDDTLQTFSGYGGSQKGAFYPSMVLGQDFLKAHRVLIANGQHKMYFSYNGGPVFSKLEPK